MRRLLLVGILLTSVTLWAGGPAGAMPGCATGSVIRFELARTEATAIELIGGCDEAGLDEIRDALRFDDRVFVPLYVAAIAFWSLVVGRRLEWSSPRRRWAALAAAPLIVLAAPLDLLENHHLRTVVDAAGASPAIGDAFVASVAKWALALYGIAVSLVVLVRAGRAAFSAAG